MDTKGMSFAERNEYWDMVLDEYESSGLDRNEERIGDGSSGSHSQMLHKTK